MGTLFQDRLADWSSVVTYDTDSGEAGSWGRREWSNKEKGERPPLEAATKQGLVKTEKTLCVL
jgi:hypothetical protein